MGAVAALLHSLQNSNTAKNRLTKEDYLREAGCESLPRNNGGLVKAIVLDSPFHNFRDVAKETAMSNFSIPSFLADAAVNYMESSFSRILAQRIGDQYNPFLINFTQEINLSIPIIMLYSEKDEVVPPSHSERLIKNIKSKFEKILIN
jgi:pimeloyl-ACP methyl ester carboxylesterase